MRSASSRLLFLALLLAACGEPVPTPPVDGGRRDARPVEPDAAPVDAARPDAQRDDGGDTDGGGTIFDPDRCRADATDDVFTLATDTLARVRDVGVAAGAELLGVAWSYRDEGTENVWLAEIPATGAALIAGQQITTGTSLQRDPVLAANGAGWTIAWYGNPDGDFDVYAQGWETGRIVTGGSRQRLTMRTGRDDAPALLALAGGGAMAGWVETRGAAMTERVPVLRPLSAISEPTAAQRDGASSTGVPSFVLAPRSGGLSLAYVQSGSAMPDAQLQPLDASGAPVGAPITLSTEHNADGSVDVAADAGGGAVVFGTTVGGLRPEVRARLIDGSGMLQSGTSERVITVAPASGRDATIAPLAGGYVIAYRALEGTPTVRLDFRDAELAPTVTLDVASASASGGRVTVRVSGEGRMIVGWADVDATASTTAIRAARVRCD